MLDALIAVEMSLLPGSLSRESQGIFLYPFIEVETFTSLLSCPIQSYKGNSSLFLWFAIFDSLLHDLPVFNNLPPLPPLPFQEQTPSSHQSSENLCRATILLETPAHDNPHQANHLRGHLTERVQTLKTRAKPLLPRDPAAWLSALRGQRECLLQGYPPHLHGALMPKASEFLLMNFRLALLTPPQVLATAPSMDANLLCKLTALGVNCSELGGKGKEAWETCLSQVQRAALITFFTLGYIIIHGRSKAQISFYLFLMCFIICFMS